MHVKWQSNAEKHRGYISTHRNDASYSALYAAYEDQFIKIADDTKDGKKETIFRMDKLEKNLLESDLLVRDERIIICEAYVCCVDTSSSVKLIKIIIAEAMCDLSCSVRAEVVEND